MAIMRSTVKEKDVVLFEAGVDRFGKLAFRISWYNGTQWGVTQYSSYDEAYATYRMLRKMLRN